MSHHTKDKATQLSIEGAELDSLSMSRLDKAVYERFGCICGIDEAGRGPLAGDVYAAAVILNPDDHIEGLNDSKKLSAKKRELLFDEIIRRSKAYAIGIATVHEIEETDILSAALLAMKRAYEGLGTTAGIVLIDGDVLPDIDGCLRNLNHGDARSEAIAAASILAKVSRDRYMCEQAKLYPQYGFEKHAGYGTKAHYAAIDEYGVCPIHRLSFLKKHFEKNGKAD